MDSAGVKLNALYMAIIVALPRSNAETEWRAARASSIRERWWG